MVNTIHLKRHMAPLAWPIKRKNITFIAKPNPGSYKLRYVVPLVALVRDCLKVAETAKEVKLILNNSEVLVNGKRVKDSKYPVGMFDIVEFKKSGEKYQVLFDNFGKIKVVPVKDDLLFLKVSNKTFVKGGKVQINFMNGFNVLVDNNEASKIRVNDSIKFDCVKKKIIEVLPLKEGNFVYFFDGKFKGLFGRVKGFKEYYGVTKSEISVEIDGKIHTTAKDYAFVVGTKKEDLKRFE